MYKRYLRLVMWRREVVTSCMEIKYGRKVCVSDEEPKGWIMLIAYGTSAPSPVHSLFWDTLAGLLKTTFPRFPCNWLPLEVGLLTGAS